MPLDDEIRKEIDSLTRKVVRQFVEKLSPLLEAEARRICIETTKKTLASACDSPEGRANETKPEVKQDGGPSTNDLIRRVMASGEWFDSVRAVTLAVMAYEPTVEQNSVDKAISRLIDKKEIGQEGNRIRLKPPEDQSAKRPPRVRKPKSDEEK